MTALVYVPLPKCPEPPLALIFLPAVQEELAGSAWELGVPPVVPPQAHYSRPQDAPAHPTVFAGREFRWGSASASALCVCACCCNHLPCLLCPYPVVLPSCGDTLIEHMLCALLLQGTHVCCGSPSWLCCWRCPASPPEPGSPAAAVGHCGWPLCRIPAAAPAAEPPTAASLCASQAPAHPGSN